jgi:hypothetical protein
VLLRMLYVDLCLLRGSLGICLGVCGIYVSLVRRGDTFF